jgi:hypothetical protein
MVSEKCLGQFFLFGAQLRVRVGNCRAQPRLGINGVAYVYKHRHKSCPRNLIFTVSFMGSDLHSLLTTCAKPCLLIRCSGCGLPTQDRHLPRPSVMAETAKALFLT